ncbi:unnamed protein product, partial [Rhizoctonia solani]
PSAYCCYRESSSTKDRIFNIHNDLQDSVNQSKGDKDPAEWMPPLSSYYCTYVRAWITVKYYYDLSVDSAEKSALTSYLNNC